MGFRDRHFLPGREGTLDLGVVININQAPGGGGGGGRQAKIK